MTSSTIRPSSCSTSSRTPREHPLRGSGRSRPGPRALHEALPVDDCPFDWSLPTRIVDVDGRVLAHVDLGALGVADRWADIAVAAMSTTRNCGPGWERTLIDAYGIAPDSERLAYCRDLWNAT